MQDNLQVTMDEFLPLRDVVFNTLRQAILTGELKPGERLMEIHLANKLGVSRTPIREAIRKLELEGLVTMIPRRGAEVAQITEKSMNDVLEVRRAMDALCVELACDRITPEELQDLKKACDTFEAAVKTDDIKQIAQADVIPVRPRLPKGTICRHIMCFIRRDLSGMVDIIMRMCCCRGVMSTA